MRQLLNQKKSKYEKSKKIKTASKKNVQLMINLCIKHLEEHNFFKPDFHFGFSKSISIGKTCRVISEVILRTVSSYHSISTSRIFSKKAVFNCVSFSSNTPNQISPTPRVLNPAKRTVISGAVKPSS